MTLDDYQSQAKTTDIAHSDPLMGSAINALGLAGEAGEVADKWKKILAYKNGELSDEDREEIAKELGDVMWYVAVFADNLGISLEDIAKMNIAKLADRKDREVLKGEGDNR